jgi:hypothetical protein
MRILLDECVPWPMHRLLTGHVCTTAQRRGWGGIANGELLQMAAAEFDLFITADQGIRYQQNLANRPLAVLEFSSNDLRRLLAAKRAVEEAVSAIAPQEYRRLEIP